MVVVYSLFSNGMAAATAKRALRAMGVNDLILVNVLFVGILSWSMCRFEDQSVNECGK